MADLLNACTTTRIYCRPDCPPGRRTLPQHRVSFASAEAARAAGYRACKVCRPDDRALPAGPWVPLRKRPERFGDAAGQDEGAPTSGRP